VTALDYRELLTTADRAARAGGGIVRDYFGRLESVRQKAPGDWVSEADLASEQAGGQTQTGEGGLQLMGSDREELVLLALIEADLGQIKEAPRRIVRGLAGDLSLQRLRGPVHQEPLFTVDLELAFELSRDLKRVK
jgi:hypothetical protein